MTSKVTLALAVALAGCSAASAQGHGGPPPGGPGGPGGGRGPIGGGNMGNNPRAGGPGQNFTSSSTSLQIGPSGRWWDDSRYVESLNLTSSQQHRMDRIFDVNRPTLVKLLTNLKQAETQLEQLKRSGQADESTLFPQIDRVTQARSELAKANAHLLFQIRKEMTPEQTSRLDEHRQQ